jgi:hypothetical protein
MHMSYIYWYSVICLIPDELHLLVLCYMPYTGTLSIGEDIPNISDPDPTNYCIIVACTVTVQLPMRVLHGVCYSYTSGGDDQSPNVVY